MEKRWWKSKTIWWNALSLVVTVTGAGLLYVDQLGLTESQAGLAGLVLTLVTVTGNFVLRFKTSEGIS